MNMLILKGYLRVKKFGIDFKPEAEIESLFACPIKVTGLDTKGKHSWAYIALETRDATLPATVKCNGREYKSNGVTLCQSSEGLKQSIYFDVPVYFMPEKHPNKICSSIKYKVVADKKIFYNIPNRECTYYIREKNAARSHRLITIGYEDLLLREN